MARCDEYVSRYSVCKNCNNEVVDCGREKCPVYNAPAADVVEVRHGEWISVEGDVIWKCSLCDAEISTSWDYENEDMFKYCPCCGARMDGERKEQT